MDFNPNSLFMWIIAACVIVFVLAQSVFFLVQAYRRGKAIGMPVEKLKRTIISTAVFTIAPAVSVMFGLVMLYKALGIPLPWVRLSVIGALTYELPAAQNTATVFGLELNKLITDPKVFSAITWVMTLGIIPSVILPPLMMKPIRGGMLKIKNKDSKWGDIFQTCLFLGMISAFLGMVFADVSKGIEGWIPVFVMIVSAVVMAVCGILIKKCKMKWLENYAITISMLCAMAFAVLIEQI